MDQGNAVLEKWCKWLDAIYHHVVILFDDRRMFRELLEIVDKNPQVSTPPGFLNWIAHLYSTTQVIGIRRQLKSGNNKSISLKKLLCEIKEAHQFVTRDRLERIYRARDCFFETVLQAELARFPSSDGIHLDPRVIEADLGQLAQISKNVEDLADKRVAHFDRGRAPDTVTYQNLDQCVQILGDLTLKYLSLVKADGARGLEPVHTMGDWREVLRRPWIRNDQ